jgi:hypothetical protein
MQSQVTDAIGKEKSLLNIICFDSFCLDRKSVLIESSSTLDLLPILLQSRARVLEIEVNPK